MKNTNNNLQPTDTSLIYNKSHSQLLHRVYTYHFGVVSDKTSEHFNDDLHLHSGAFISVCVSSHLNSHAMVGFKHRCQDVEIQPTCRARIEDALHVSDNLHD